MFIHLDIAYQHLSMSLEEKHLYVMCLYEGEIIPLHFFQKDSTQTHLSLYICLSIYQNSPRECSSFYHECEFRKIQSLRNVTGQIFKVP